MVKRYTGDLLLRNGIPQERKEYEGTYAERLAFSTDGLKESDMWLEIDTGKVYFWSETANGWVTGSGGGGGSDDSYVVKFYATDSEDETWVCDKTYAEIVASIESGNELKVLFANNSDYTSDIWTPMQFAYDGNMINCFFISEPIHNDGDFMNSVGYTLVRYTESYGVEVFHPSLIGIPEFSLPTDRNKFVKLGNYGLEWASVSGGGGTFYVTADRAEGTADKTMAEIKAAVDAGMNVQCKVVNGSAINYIPLASLSVTGAAQDRIWFYGFSSIGFDTSEDLTSVEFYAVKIAKQDGEEYAEVTMPFFEPA